MSKALILFVFFSITLLFSLEASQACEQNNDHWLLLRPDSVKEDQWRKTSSTRFLSVSLDLNGDSIDDVASLVVSSDKNQSAVRICLGDQHAEDRGGNCSILAVDENIAASMGLERKPAGCYAYQENDSGNPSSGNKICSENDILEYFKLGSASSFFVFNQTTKGFDRYWDSD